MIDLPELQNKFPKRFNNLGVPTYAFTYDELEGYIMDAVSSRDNTITDLQEQLKELHESYYMKCKELDKYKRLSDDSMYLVRAFKNGYKLVPIEPTEEMLYAGYDATRLPDGTPQFYESGFCLGHASKIHKAMLESAPDLTKE